MPKVTIIVPVYNEADNIIPLYAEIKKNCLADFEILWIDDGSTDTTYSEIQLLADSDSRVSCLSLSRNFGHQNAIMAGLDHATGEYTIIMDGDLQHPPSCIPLFLQKIEEGYDIVAAQRKKTQSIPFFKKIFSTLFYKFINFISDIPIEENVSDFRAFNNKVLTAVRQFEERDLFLRGLFSWVGFKKTTIQFEAPSRRFGKSKYSYAQMLRLALKGTTSFSFKPLRISLLIGAIVSGFAFLLLIISLITYFRGQTVPGWTSIMTVVTFMGGTQLLVIGLMGEYIAGLFRESKKRPLYIVNEKININ
ncbi:MAG: glycosyltransferase family 2 protein [Sphingobacteriales bacterium]|nr:glycosyltransferase family 2 protein [Sphingobacteriales bacterium]